MTNQSATSLLLPPPPLSAVRHYTHSHTNLPRRINMALCAGLPFTTCLYPIASLYCCIATTLFKPPLSLSSVTLNFFFFFFYPWVLLFYTTSVTAEFMPLRMFIKSYFSDDSEGVVLLYLMHVVAAA